MKRVAARSDDPATGLKSIGALLVVLLMALVVLLLVRARPAPEPFDPRSGQPDGARGLVVTLQQFGATVIETRVAPSRGADTIVFVLDDRLDDDQRTAVVEFAESGGRLVVADPDSSLHGGSGVDGGAVQVIGFDLPDARRSVEQERNVEPGRCSLDALAPVRGVYAPDGVLFPVGPNEPACLATEGHAFVIERTIGSGSVVGLGDNEPFVNRHLRRADNAALAVALLAPSSDAEANRTVTFLVGNGAAPTVADIGSGEERLFDLIPTWVWMSLALGALAVVVFAVSRGARVGKIVAEPVVSPRPGSELVSATGNLMARAGHAGHAASLILGRLHRDLCERHGISPSAPLADLDRAVVELSGTRPGEIERLLTTVVTDDAGLLAVTRHATEIRHRRERTPT
ncbi:MAG: DUF4350 domain-containing protein [Ilumatobacter sp.]|uniref:DUF4350 domain-containing protein n=1 Tax=Ilumatobacter sp. TaxID=1967498 RepID=UPI00391AE769